MVLVRESPQSQLSPDKNPAQWPPRSPFQALLSSPNGRKRWADRQNRARATSPSPSSKRSQKLQEMVELSGDEAAEDEEEDEETLQLKLQEIQAKLKLKRLQASKKSGGSSSDGGGENGSESIRSTSPSKSQRRALSPAGLYKAAVEVPLSPVRRPRIPQEQLSPARRRLGLTTAPRAQDVSLKRARDGSQVKRQRLDPSLPSSEALPKPKSFSERLANSKVEAEEKELRKARLDSIRSDGFNHKRMERTTTTRQRSPLTPPIHPSDPQTEELKQRNCRATDSNPGKTEASASRSMPAPSCSEVQKPPSEKTKFNAGAYGQASGTGHAESEDESTLQPHSVDDDDAGYDPFSKIHLARRHIPHPVVAREMEGKQIYSLPRLLKEVKSPEYEPPDCESDYVLFAVLASKSNPLDHAQTHRTTEQSKDGYEAPRNKFMVLHLCDLKWEIDVFLFGTAFNQFWKLTPGTLLAILNPAILPPKGNQNNGRFSLKLGSSEDAVMEIGVARDLGYCSATKKDGQQCGDWIDKRKTEACEFHLSLQVEKSRKGRMEVNTMFRGAGSPTRRGRRQVVQDGRANKRGSGRFDSVYGQLYAVNSGMGRSVASLLDAEDTDALHNMTQEEASRKRIANAQRERDLAKKLAEMGKGAGAEYLRASQSHASSAATTTSATPVWKDDAAGDARNALFSKPSVSDLGLLGKKASDAHLSPAKDRKRHFGLGALSMPSQTSNSTPMGWGGARKAGLLQPKESRMGSPERGQTKLDTGDGQSRANLVRPRSQGSSMRSNGSSSPVKKKARFVLEKGIREPGRDSLPGVSNAATSHEEDDDDLDIIL